MFQKSLLSIYILNRKLQQKLFLTTPDQALQTDNNIKMLIHNRSHEMFPQSILVELLFGQLKRLL